jgi:hypothetical protein
MVGIETRDQFGEQNHNTNQHFFAGLNSFQKKSLWAEMSPAR